jgi:hypothetical protein
MALDRKKYFEEHLWYEIWMLGETYKLLNLSKVPISEVVGNALIESFCVHARVLIEFFEKSQGADYYTTVPYVRSKKYKKLNRQINNQISHVIGEGRSDRASEKIGPDERKELIDLLGADIAIFKKTLRASCDQWRQLPDVPDSALTGADTAVDSVLFVQRSSLSLPHRASRRRQGNDRGDDGGLGCLSKDVHECL